jgi:hypothetical protein
MIAAFHIAVAMKPLDGNFAQNALEHGVAGLNIDGCRAAGTPESTRFDPKKHAHEGWRMTSTGSECAANASPSGRWPANVILGHSPECELLGEKRITGNPTSKIHHDGYDGKSHTGFIRGVSHPGNQHSDPEGKETVADWDCSPECPVSKMGEQSGIRKGMSGGGAKNFKKKDSWAIQPYNRQLVRPEWVRCDTGTAARYFKQVSEYKK